MGSQCCNQQTKPDKWVHIGRVGDFLTALAGWGLYVQSFSSQKKDNPSLLTWISLGTGVFMASAAAKALSWRNTALRHSHAHDIAQSNAKGGTINSRDAAILGLFWLTIGSSLAGPAIKVAKACTVSEQDMQPYINIGSLLLGMLLHLTFLRSCYNAVQTIQQQVTEQNGLNSNNNKQRDRWVYLGMLVDFLKTTVNITLFTQGFHSDQHALDKALPWEVLIGMTFACSTALAHSWSNRELSNTSTKQSTHCTSNYQALEAGQQGAAQKQTKDCWMYFQKAVLLVDWTADSASFAGPVAAYCHFFNVDTNTEIARLSISIGSLIAGFPFSYACFRSCSNAAGRLFTHQTTKKDTPTTELGHSNSKQNSC